MPAVAPPLTVLDLAQIAYEPALALQMDLAARHAENEIGDTLLLLEHPHTYTYGSSGKREHLLAPQEELRRDGIEVVVVDRGGDITYHGPGQLVGYPILRLKDYNIGVVHYVRCLEEALIRVAQSYGLAAGRQRGYTGVWVGDAKLAAIGVKVDKRGITRHGFALNITTDLRYFERIIPCGIRDKAVCSLESLLGYPVERADVMDRVVRAFEEIFDPEVAPHLELRRK